MIFFRERWSGIAPVNVRRVGESRKIVKQTDSGFRVDAQAGPEGHPLSSGSPCPPELSHMTLSWVGTPVLALGSISNFLDEISSLSHSGVFLYFFALIAEEGFLSLLAILWNSTYRCLYLSFSPLLFASLLFTAICKASPDSHFAFLHFFSMGMVLIPVSCTMS